MTRQTENLLMINATSNFRIPHRKVVIQMNRKKFAIGTGIAAAVAAVAAVGAAVTMLVKRHRC